MNKVMKRISGAKAGDAPRQPVEHSDTLRSKQYGHIIDIVSEGEIVGLKHGLRSVFLNETPLQNVDGTFNFQNVSVDQRFGTVNQSAFAGQNNTEFEISVNTEVKATAPVTRSINTPNVNAVRVTISIPQLTQQDKTNGDLTGTSVKLKIQVQTDGGGFTDVRTDTITGKSSSKYQKSYIVPLNGEGPWDIRVVRETPDSESISLANATYWDSYTGIIYTKLAYPHSAAVSVQVDAANFNSIPNRAYEIRGIIVRVPTNYDPVARTYSGIWDGTFKLAWTNNPAWVFYDLAINERYGTGQFVKPETIDKWNLYSIGKYCDEMVSDGRGGTEPRFTCNLYLQSREDALRVLQNLASVFRGVAYWASSVMAVQDRPTDPIASFTNANVVDGNFSYTGTGLKQRHTVALVGWNDPTDFYRQKIEYVQDDDDIQKYGVIETQVSAFGCSSRSQAHRLGKWTLAVERMTTETISFAAGLDGMMMYPGCVFQTSDILRAGVRFGGRILAATNGATPEITLDAPVTMEAGHNYTISVTLPDGTMETKPVQTVVGDQTVIRATSAFSAVPQEAAIWVLTDTASLKPELWRCMSLDESGGLAQITALAYVPDMYDAVENGLVLEERPISIINVRPNAPTNLKIRASQYVIGGNLMALRAAVSWSGNAPRYIVSWRRSGGGAWQSREVTECNYDIEGLDTGDVSEPITHEVKVVAVNSVGRKSAEVVKVFTFVYEIEESIDMMAAPEELALVAPFTGNTLSIHWKPVVGALRYEVQIGLPTGEFVAKRTEILGNVFQYTYTAEDMSHDGGPWRNIKLRVRALGLFSNVGAWSELTASNPQVGQLDGILVEPGVRSIFFSCAQPADLDLAGIRVWADTDAGFAPSESNLVYDGPSMFASFNSVNGVMLNADTTYYVRAAGYDSFGTDNLNVSSSFAIDPIGTLPSAGEIVENMIADGALTITKFADGIEPVSVVDSLPDPAGYTGPVLVILTTDSKLYRYENGAWVTHITSVQPGTITPDLLDDALKGQIEQIPLVVESLEEARAKLDGPATTPGTVAHQITGEVAQKTALLDSDITFIGAMADTAVAAARVALQSNATATQAQQTYSAAIAAKMTGNITAAVTEEREARVTAEQAIATRIDGLNVTWGADIDSAISTYSATVATQFDAQAQQITTLESQVGTNASNITTLSQTTATQHDAQATLITDLTTRVGTAESSITTLSNTVTTETGALAESIEQISTTVDGHTTAIQTTQNSVDGVSARVEVKIDNNGVISGYALDSTTNRYGVPTSAMVFAVDKFQIKGVGTAATVLFEVSTRGGSQYVTINGASITNNTVSADQIKANAITADKIDANAITAGKIAAGAVNTAQLAAGAITTDVIVIGVNGGLPGTMIANDGITTVKLAAGAITADKIGANAVTADKILANTITGDKIQVNTITADKIDARGLSIKDASGNVILAAGTALDWSRVGGVNRPADNATNTTNTNQLTDGAGLGTKATWTGVTGTGKPADNATVGAPAGTYVGSTLAQTVESNASTALTNANTAINGLADKLSKSAASILSAPITLQTSGSIVVGTATDGITYGATGLVAKKAGVAKFTLTSAGDATFAGALAAATGTLGSLTIDASAAGEIKSSNYSNTAGAEAGFRIASDGTANFASGKLGGNPMTATELKSPNFVAGSTGWRVKTDGSAEFWNMNLRGSIVAEWGTIGGINIGTASNLNCLALGQTNYNTGGSGFWLGMHSGVPKFSIGDPLGARMTWDGSAFTVNGAIIQGATLNNPTMDTFSVALDNTSIVLNTSNGPVTYDTIIATPTGGKGTITYKWSLVSTSTSFGVSCALSSASGSSTSVSGNASNNIVEAEVTCVATDANGRTASASCSVYVTHGTPP